MKRYGLPIFSLLLLADLPGIDAEIRRHRVGDAEHPWILIPVTGRLNWGQPWAVEIITDDDGDGLIDEDSEEKTERVGTVAVVY